MKNKVKKVWLCSLCQKSHKTFIAAAYCCEPEKGFECQKCGTVYKTEDAAINCQECAGNPTTVFNSEYA